MAHVVLNTAAKIPGVGLGCWKIEKTACAKVISEAMKAGYRHFDCAADYGNEKEVGEGIAIGLKELGLKREDIWVTSKLWNTYHAKEHVKPACERSISDLGVGYLDLYLIHFPLSFQYVPFEEKYPGECPKDANGKTLMAKVSIRETWEAMEDLVEAGLVKNIGVSNFNNQMIYDLLTYCKITPAMHQFECHPYLPQKRGVKFAQERGIAVTAYSSFGGSSYVELGSPVAKSTPSLLEIDAVKKIAEKHSKTTAQVLLRWAREQNIIVIPKSSNVERLAQNLDVDSFKLDEEDMKSLDTIDAGIRFNDVSGDAVWGTDIYG